MKTFNGYLIPEYVQEDDWPDIGEIFVALDQQNRLGPETWLVAVQGDGTAQGDTVQLGLFWWKQVAIKFVETIENDDTFLQSHLKRVDQYYERMKNSPEARRILRR